MAGEHVHTAENRIDEPSGPNLFTAAENFLFL
jgi:hypothetical protein